MTLEVVAIEWHAKKSAETTLHILIVKTFTENPLMLSVLISGFAKCTNTFRVQMVVKRWTSKFQIIYKKNAYTFDTGFYPYEWGNVIYYIDISFNCSSRQIIKRFPKTVDVMFTSVPRLLCIVRSGIWVSNCPTMSINARTSYFVLTR